MPVFAPVPALDAILADWRPALGRDFAGYRNHAMRVHHVACALVGADAVQAEKIAIAAAFHDLGIWAEGTFDYLDPSAELARAHLARLGHPDWGDEIAAMIVLHHKITPWRAQPSWLVEPFRKADLVDLSLGAVRFGLPRRQVSEIRAAFPNAGFHRTLGRLVLRRLRSHPFDPMPMLRW